MALAYAKKYPQYVSHLVLLACGPNQSAASHTAADQAFQDSVCPRRKEVLEENLRHLPAELAAHPEKRFITFCIRFGARSWYQPDFDATALWLGVQVNMKIFDYLWGKVFAEIDITEDLEALTMPVFLGLGRYDFLVSPPWMWNEVRKKFRKLTFRVFEKSSHTPQLEEPELFDQELLRWVNKIYQG
jgi:proline iminopeptidase